MRPPFATLVLFAAVAGAYFFVSGGQLFLSDAQLGNFGVQPSNPVSFFSHLFVHVGVLHLAGNVLPLLAFGFLAEAAIGTEVLLVFLLAGVLGGVLFALANPGVALVGASAGISGLIGAAFSLRPKQSTVALIAIPLLVFFVVFPAVNVLVSSQQQFFVAQQAELSEQAQKFATENKPVEAQAALERSSEAAAKASNLSSGEAREKGTQTDALVHALGVIIGFLYVFVFHRKAFVAGALELRLVVLSLRRRLRLP